MDREVDRELNGGMEPRLELVGDRSPRAHCDCTDARRARMCAARGDTSPGRGDTKGVCVCRAACRGDGVSSSGMTSRTTSWVITMRLAPPRRTPLPVAVGGEPRGDVDRGEVGAVTVPLAMPRARGGRRAKWAADAGVWSLDPKKNVEPCGAWEPLNGDDVVCGDCMGAVLGRWRRGTSVSSTGVAPSSASDSMATCE